jgi:quinol monooxygenase YgiN
MVIRLFLSAVAPGDIDRLIEYFSEDVVAAFEAHPACLGIELIRAEQPGLGGLIEGGALSRWTSVAEMEEALQSEELVASQNRVRELLHRTPIRKVYEVMA